MSRGLYRGVYTSLVDDPDFQALSPHARLAFYTARLCQQAGPAAIYRYYPELLARQSGLSARQIETALQELERGCWIEREGVILWVRNGLRHDPVTTLRNDNHRKSIIKWLDGLPRLPVVAKFAIYYGLPIPIGIPSESPSDHRIPSPSPSPSPKSESNAAAPDAPLLDPHAASAGITNGAAPLPPPVARALDRMPLLGPQLRDAPWWQSELRAHPALDLVTEALRAEAWCRSNPGRAPRRQIRRFLHAWFLRAEEPR